MTFSENGGLSLADLEEVQRLTALVDGMAAELRCRPDEVPDRVRWLLALRKNLDEKASAAKIEDEPSGGVR